MNIRRLPTEEQLGEKNVDTIGLYKEWVTQSHKYQPIGLMPTRRNYIQLIKFN